VRRDAQERQKLSCGLGNFLQLHSSIFCFCISPVMVPFKLKIMLSDNTEKSLNKNM